MNTKLLEEPSLFRVGSSDKYTAKAGRKVVYIAGPMTGKYLNNYPAFAMAKECLLKHGFAVISPADVTLCLEKHQYMDIRAAMVRCCDAIFLLDGWDESTCAMAEYHYALSLGKEIWHETV